MTQEQAPRPQRPRPHFRTVEVKRAERLTPHIVRVVFGGDELEGFATRGPAEHIKVFLPRFDEDRPILPEWGPDGPVFAEGQERPLSRTYTPRIWNAERRELTVDFLMHGDGPGSLWADATRPGRIAVVTGPGGAYRLDANAAWYLIGGDESAIPAIGTILEALPASARTSVFIETEDALEEQELSSPASFGVAWLHRDSTEGAEPGRLLESALKRADLWRGEGRVWVGCEAGVMRDIRRHLLFEGGLAREAIDTHGYWKQGVVNHPDHDIGQEI